MACELEPTYRDVSAKDWDDFLENVWTPKKEELYKWTRPGKMFNSSGFPFGDKYVISLPLSDYNKEREAEFRKIFLEDIENVENKLKTYSWKDSFKDSFESLGENGLRVLIHGTIGGLCGLAVGAVVDSNLLGVAGATAVSLAVFEPLLSFSRTLTKNDVLKNLEKLKDCDALEIRYCPEIEYYKRTKG